MNNYKKNLKMMKYIIIGFVILFIISLSSFYFILLPKINNSKTEKENEESNETSYYLEKQNI